MIDFATIGNLLIEQFHIAKNKHGVFFDMDKKQVLQITDIDREVRKIYPSMLSRDIREVICYIDDMCEKCELPSPYFRKSKTMYGLYTRR